jgi:DNA-binding GntR family transcriptional regulator
LRADIFSGRLPPGHRLRFQELSDKYGGSVGAAREALTRLVSENLVSVRPRQCYTVVTLSKEDLVDLVQARVEAESLAIRLSVAAGDMAWEASVVAAHHVLCRTAYSAESDATVASGEWLEAHRNFHLALLSGCPNRRLLNFATSLRKEAVLYQIWAVSHLPALARVRSTERYESEHRALLEAAIDRNAELAERLVREHLLKTGLLAMAVAEGESLDDATA